MLLAINFPIYLNPLTCKSLKALDSIIHFFACLSPSPSLYRCVGELLSKWCRVRFNRLLKLDVIPRYTINSKWQIDRCDCSIHATPPCFPHGNNIFIVICSSRFGQSVSRLSKSVYVLTLTLKIPKCREHQFITPLPFAALRLCSLLASQILDSGWHYNGIKH